MKEVLDMAVVDELLSICDDGDPELLLDLIGMFLNDGPQKVQAVAAGLADRDFERMERAAHSLKGSSGNLGARALQDTCEQLQQATRRRDLARSQQLEPQLQQHFEQARTALETLRRRFS